MSSKFDSQPIGSSLVLGGAGFLGFHVVSRLLKEPNHGLITVASRNPRQNQLDTVKYVELDLTDKAAISQVIEQTKPEVIFHLAAPRAVDGHIEPSVFHEGIIVGTRYVLEVAKYHPSVKALIYATTPCVNQGYEHIDLDETGPVWDEDSNTFPYFKAKAVAEAAVLQANSRLDSRGSGLLTASVRMCMIYGERDTQGIPAQLQIVLDKGTKVQLGGGQNKIEPVYAPVAADAHILTAKALLASQANSLDPKVDGEAFNVSNGDPQPFWEFSRKVWRTVGDDAKPEQVTVINQKVALALTDALSWGFWIFSLGYKKPPLNLTRMYIQIAVYNLTYSIEKARTRLGFDPNVDLDASIRSSVKSVLEMDPGKYETLKLVQ